MYDFFKRNAERESIIEKGMGVDEYSGIILFHELGITGHKDMGMINGKYQDIIYLGPLQLKIEISGRDIDKEYNPGLARYQNIKKAIMVWFGDLKDYERINSRRKSRHNS